MAEYLKQNLLFLRKRKGLTQLDMTKLLSLNSKLYQHWESGFTLPQLKDLVSLSELYSVSIEYLIRKNLRKVSKILILDNYRLIQEVLKN